jgi:SNF family Na+-dependent transporter
MELLLTILIAIPLLKAANRFRRYTEHNAIEDMEAAFRLQKTFWQTVGWITMSLIVLFFLFLIPG